MIQTRMIDLTEWAPDQPDFASPTLIQASNCVPRSPGYGPFPSLVDLPDNDPADEYIRGAISALKADGEALNFAGDRTKLYVWEPNLPVHDASNPPGYTLGNLDSWRFAQFNELVFALSENEDLQYYDMDAHTPQVSTFADVTGAPKGAVMDVVGPHLTLGRTTDANGFDPNGVHWAAANAPLSWPTDPDQQIAQQSGRRTLPGRGGWVQAVVGGTEIGAVFQERMIWRMDYVGGDIQYEFTKVEPTYGLLVPHLAIPLGRNILFLSEAGWRMFDYTQSVAVGKDRVDRWFFSEINESYLHRVSWSIDPDSTRVMIAFPSRQSPDPGNPDSILVYDWALDRFSLARLDVELLTRFRPINPAQMDGQYYKENAGDGENLDTYTPQMDDKVGDFGSEVLGAFRPDHSPASLDGTPLEAAFTTADIQLSKGRRSTVTEVRPYAEGLGSTIGVFSKQTRSDSPFPKLVNPGNDGAAKVISDGRYHAFLMTLEAGGFEDAIGFEVKYRTSGRY